MKSLFFTQKWGTYPDNTLVCVGFEKYEELIPLMKKQKTGEWVEAVEKRIKEGVPVEHCHFTDWHHKKKYYSILWLIDWKDDIAHYEVLAHELVHGVLQVLGPRIDLMKENEAFAYQMSFLFTEIAKQLKGKRYG